MKYWLVIVLLSLFLPAVTLAQENGTTSSADLTIAPTPSTIVDYPLPYPGILPDNPLYPVKMIRDRVVLFLINDPVKKAQFTLLQANKRLQAGVFLYRAKPQKAALAVETISKGEDYFFQSISHAKQVAKEGREDGTSLLSDLENASLKHEEVLKVFEKELPQEYRSHITEQLKRVKNYQNQVVGLSSSQ